MSSAVRIERGIFFRNQTEIPANRINAVKAKLTPIVGTSSVIVDTGAGQTAEAVRLTRKDARQFAAACNALKASSSPQP